MKSIRTIWLLTSQKRYFPQSVIKADLHLVLKHKLIYRTTTPTNFFLGEVGTAGLSNILYPRHK